MAGWTGLEPATFCVTGRRSNQLSYHPEIGKEAERRIRLRQVKRGFARVGNSPNRGCAGLVTPRNLVAWAVALLLVRRVKNVPVWRFLLRATGST